MAISDQNVVEILKTVYDPEIPLNVYDLGLIYSIDIAPDSSVRITMSLTTAGCPMAKTLTQTVRDAVCAGISSDRVSVDLVWDPQWNPAMISPEGRVALGMTR
ncbi:MAG: DUF59 domain-containing protein [Candidatus Schekmanbacteria bacterium]|nr:DUF59 domain-containing protein [Candidatus Schekmanbacteria bacterium]